MLGKNQLVSRITKAIILPALISAFSTLQAEAAVEAPDCAALEKWAATIDSKARWHPIEGNRTWLPKAFEGDAFENLFGAQALDWTVADTKAMNRPIRACIKQATKDKRYAEQKALIRARGHITGRLKSVLITAKRVQARAEAERKQRAQRAERERQRAEARAAQRDAALREAADSVLAQPDSPELLHDLAVLKSTDPGDPEAYRAMPPLKLGASRKFLYVLRTTETTADDPRVAPALSARYQALHDAVLEEARGEIADLDDSTRSLRVLARKLPDLRRQLGPALMPADQEDLSAAIRTKYQSIQRVITNRAMSLIDGAGDDAEAVRRIDRIVANTAKSGVNRQQYREVQSHALARQREIGDGVLAAAADRFDDYPPTLAGVRQFEDFLADTIEGIRGRASQPALASFNDDSQARHKMLARAALPEFERELAALPETETGLNEAEEKLETARNWDVLAEDIRTDYIAAAQVRRDEIAASVARQRAEQRQRAIDAGGDPELVGYTFVDSNAVSSIEFRDERLVILNMMGLRFAGEYELSLNDVIVKGPNGTIVLARQGDTLQGMGLNFTRED